MKRALHALIGGFAVVAALAGTCAAQQRDHDHDRRGEGARGDGGRVEGGRGDSGRGGYGPPPGRYGGGNGGVGVGGRAYGYPQPYGGTRQAYPGPAYPTGGYPARGYPSPAYRAPPAYGAALPVYGAPPRPNSLGAGWSQQQEEARLAVRHGQIAPLSQIIEGIGRRTPGRQLDAGIEYEGGRPVYRVRWMTTHGRRVDFLVDAASGAILGER